jgi:hypothetical protein
MHFVVWGSNYFTLNIWMTIRVKHIEVPLCIYMLYCNHNFRWTSDCFLVHLVQWTMSDIIITSLPMTMQLSSWYIDILSEFTRPKRRGKPCMNVPLVDIMRFFKIFVLIWNSAFILAEPIIQFDWLSFIVLLFRNYFVVLDL